MKFYTGGLADLLGLSIFIYKLLNFETPELPVLPLGIA